MSMRRATFIAVGIALSLALLAVFLGFLSLYPPPAARVPPPPDTTTPVDVNYDYLLIGETLASLAAAADLRAADPDATIAIVRTGNEETAALVLTNPTSYDASYGATLAVDAAAASEVNLLTMTESRRWLAALNITAYASPYGNIAVGRGRRVECNRSLAADSALVYCHTDAVFTAASTGAYRDAFADSYSGDPRIDSWNYLLQGFGAPAFDTLLQLANNYSWINTDNDQRPVNASDCDRGLDFPVDTCVAATDWRTLLAAQLASTFEHPLAYEWADWLNVANLGETASLEVGAGACNTAATLSYRLRQSVVALHPRGGFAAVRAAFKANATGVHFITMPSTVSSLVRVTGTAKVGWVNATHRVIGRFLTMVTDPTPRVANWTGNVAVILQAQRELKRAQAEPLTTVLASWVAGTPPWYWELLDRASGNYSLRVYGDLGGCIERIDVVDTPYHRCTNTLRLTSRRRSCAAFWTRLAANDTELTAYVLAELRNAFPDGNITSPASVHVLQQDAGWFTVDTNYDDISHEAAGIWAAEPIANVSLCLASASVAQYTGPGSEAEFRSARQCLYERLRLTLTTLEDVWTARDALIVGAGLATPFATIPATGGTRPLQNEEWWPYGYDALEAIPDDVVDYCAAGLVDYTNYTLSICSADVQAGC